MLYDDTSIPRIHVVDDPHAPGKLVFLNDTKAKRFGGVFLNRGHLQGMHLFSIGYCFACWAAHYCSRSSIEIVKDVLDCFHPSFLTKIALNEQFKGNNTYFQENARHYTRNLKEEWSNLKASMYVKSSLESYFNYAAALQYLFPCNVLYADNSKDPSGGGKSQFAIQNLLAKNCHANKSLEIIKNIIDHKVIAKCFEKGFDSENNITLLAYIILQVHELHTLYLNHTNERREAGLTRHEFYPKDWSSGATRNLKADLYTIMLEPLLKDSSFPEPHKATLSAQYPLAFSLAINKLQSIWRRICA